VQQPGGRPAARHAHDRGDLRGGQPRRGRLFPVDIEPPFRLARLDVPVDIDDTRRPLERRTHAAGELEALARLGAVHLRHDRLEHRRPRRHLDDLDARAQARGHRLEPRTEAPGDRMALIAPGVLVHEHHLEVRQVRVAPEEVVAHQAVERIRRRGAGVALDARHRGIVQRLVRERRRNPGRRLQRRVLRHVDDDLQLVLVVEWQHLHRDQPQRHQRHGADEQHRDQPEEARARRRSRQQRSHHAAIQGGEPIVRLLLMRVRAVEQPDRGPGRHDERDDEREHHGRRGADGNRPHVGAHQAADEGHRQNGCHHRQRREDRGVADFVHGAERDRRQPVRLSGAEARVPHDVLHHYDGIVHEDADGEDEREQRDAVQRVAIKKEHE